jgi:hypothetical protein
MLEALMVLAYVDPDEGSGTLTLLLVAIVLVAIAAVALIVRWAIGRSCPRCGKRVARGKLDCRHCEFDFRSIGS